MAREYDDAKKDNSAEGAELMKYARGLISKEILTDDLTDKILNSREPYRTIFLNMSDLSSDVTEGDAKAVVKTAYKRFEEMAKEMEGAVQAQ